MFGISRLGAGIAGLLLGLIVPAALHAAQIDFHVAGTENGSYTEGQGNSRDTHFRANANLNLVQLGVHFDPLNDTELNVGTPDGSIIIRWRIYGSDSEGRVFAPVFESNTINHSDSGMGEYNTSVNVPLAGGSYYVLSMEVVTGGFGSLRHLESSQGLPLTTSDNNFLVLNGGNNNNSTPTGNFGSFSNAILPAFSVTVPEPASIALVLGGAALMLRRRRWFGCR